MGLVSDKKGIFFTIFAILVLSLFLFSTGMYNYTKQRDSTIDRVKTLNNFVSYFEEDMNRKMYASGFRIIFLIQKDVIESGEYVSDFNASFSEVFLEGKLKGAYLDEEWIAGILYQEIIDSLNENANKINAEIIFEDVSVSVSQDSPWEIKVSIEADVVVRDMKNVASWEKRQEFVAYIPIEGFEDTLYLVETRGLLSNKINRTLYDSFVDGEDVSNLINHLEGKYYIHSTLAPSFIDKLEGKRDANENGIESFVYLPTLYNYGISPKNRAVVDYIYFSEGGDYDLYSISGMPSWFKLDEEHLEVYGVADISSPL
jgi:hypothetical protein